MWLNCAPTVLLTSLIRAPIPSRLLLVPLRAMSSQWPEFGLRLIQISAFAFKAVNHHVDSPIAVQIAKGAAPMPSLRTGGETCFFCQWGPFTAGPKIAEHTVVLIDWLAGHGDGLHVPSRDKICLSIRRYRSHTNPRQN